MPFYQSPRNKRRNIPSDMVGVYARIRKVNDNEMSCITLANDTTLKLQSPANKITECHFTQVFERNVDQKHIFESVAKPMIDDLMIGNSGLLFTYGVTNSGKTYTMAGTVKEPGLLPRSLDMIFNSILGLQTPKYRFVPDDMNRFEMQTEAEALLQKQEKDYMPTLKDHKAACRSPASKNVYYDVEHCYSENVDTSFRYAVFVSYVEIYNEHIFDLLGEDLLDSCKRARPLSTKRLREDKKKNMFVYGASQVEVQTTEEAFLEFQHGQERRRIAHTQLNALSSRSHSIFIIRLVQAPMDQLGEDLLQDPRLTTVSQLSLVDLAGSERLSRTASRHDRLREAGSINNSLMTLRTCLAQLREIQKNNSKEMVKYRNSKLTHLFKSYFEGHGKIKMLLCLNPNMEEYEENFQVVQFAEIAQEVEVGKSQANKGHSELKKQLFKAKLMEERSSSCSPVASPFQKKDILPDSSSEWESVSYSFAEFPHFDLDDCMDAETMPGLIEYLQDRIRWRESVSDAVSSMCSLFRQNVANGTLSNRDLHCRMTEMESELFSNTKEVAKLERQVKKLESKNQVLTKSTQIYKQDNKELQDQLSNAELKLKNTQYENQQLEAKLPDAIYKTKLKVEKAYDRHIRHVQGEMEDKIRAKDDCLTQLRNIISYGKYTPPSNKPSTSSTATCSSSSGSRIGYRRRSKSVESIFPEQKRSKVYSFKSSATGACSSMATKPVSKSTSKRKFGSSVNEPIEEEYTAVPVLIDETTNTTIPKMVDAKSSTILPRMIDAKSSTIGPTMRDRKINTTGPKMIDERINTNSPRMVDEKTSTIVPKLHDKHSSTARFEMADEGTITTPALNRKQFLRSNGQGDSSTYLKDQENERTLGCRFVNRNDENTFRYRPAPPVATKYRRSCSSGSNWLAHFPGSTIQPETILQPCIKPSKVVNVPSPKDVANANKYVLTHQCEDTDGEIETQLVKGEIFPTRTGGQQVQFVDVETLKQFDPKRHVSSTSPKWSRNYDSDDSTEQSSWTDVETRCAFGIGFAKDIQPEQPDLD